MATIKQIKDTEGNVHDILSTIGYGTCTTSAATAAKVATISDTSWTLKVGSIIGIKYTYSNSAGTSTTPVTLNVNSTGAKNIWYNNAKYTSTSTNICGYANRVIYYMYDGTYWVWMNSGALDGNTNTVPCIQIETAAGTAAKTGTCTNYSLLENSYAHANIRYSNTLKTALTLNVNSKGAKPIYINGTASSESNYTLPAGTYIIYYDGTNYHFRTDGVLPGTILNAINDDNGNNISATYTRISDFDSFTLYAEQTYTKSMLSVTYSRLVNLRDNGQLIPGQQYRITDYVTTVSSGLNEISAGHKFDIIVTADSENILNEEARVIQNDNDTYFNDSNLSAWKIWYSLDNDEDRFNWANEEGYGVIYRMIDEYGNDCPYDFKNIQFKVGDKYFYTFTFVEAESDLNGLVYDVSCKYGGYSGSVYNNVINRYISNNIQYLNGITFISYAYYEGGEYRFGYNFYNNTFGNNCYNNTFFNNCYNNTFGTNCYNNTFDNHCQSNTFGDVCHSNTFGDGCCSNKFGSYCDSNTFGNDCSYNTFGDWCGVSTLDDTTFQGNEFMEGCKYNLFGDYCRENKFSKNCSNNTFGTNCYYNKFGNDCINNTFGTKCYNNIFGTVNSNNEFDSNAGSCSRNTFGTNCYNNKLFNSCNNNSFDIDCHDNEFGTSCTYNKFDTLCAAIKFGSNCSYNTLGNGCTNITFGISSTIRSYYRRIIIDSGNRYIYLNCGTSGSSKYYQNVRIGLGVNNTNTYKTIADGNINQTFETYYKPSESQTILI